MKILLVRHAQSGNNIVQATVHKKFAAGVTTEAQAQEEWLYAIGQIGLCGVVNVGERQESAFAAALDGLAQLAKLRKHCGKLRKKAQINGKIKMICSPMTRACQTAKAVSEALGVPVVEVRGELCEVGGIYTVERKQHAGGSAFSKYRFHEDIALWGSAVDRVLCDRGVQG
eukprot:3254225-Rhodomonas_salina.2